MNRPSNIKNEGNECVCVVAFHSDLMCEYVRFSDCREHVELGDGLPVYVEGTMDSLSVAVLRQHSQREQCPIDASEIPAVHLEVQDGLADQEVDGLLSQLEEDGRLEVVGQVRVAQRQVAVYGLSQDLPEVLPSHLIAHVRHCVAP